MEITKKDRQALHRMLRKDRRITELKITSELNEHLDPFVNKNCPSRVAQKSTVRKTCNSKTSAFTDK